MLDLYEELTELIAVFTRKDVPYALCGGLALAVHGVPRATVDIDLLAPPEALPALFEAAAARGFTLPAAPMSFAAGRVEMRRRTKPATGDCLVLDVILVTDELEDIWDGREAVEWEHGRLWVVSREGLVRLKSLRGSGQDLVDIQNLEMMPEHDEPS